MFLLDTNVISEIVQSQPDVSVEDWLAHANEDHLFISVVTILEMRYGIQRMTKGRRQSFLNQWLENAMPTRFAGRIFDVDAEIADFAGRLAAERSLAGRPFEATDALIAATALVHGLTVVTRNTKDFVGSVKAVLNPWTVKRS
jgi:toxin FitB